MKHTTKIWLVLSLALVVLLMGATLAFAADTETAGDVTTSTETTDTASEATTEDTDTTATTEEEATTTESTEEATETDAETEATESTTEQTTPVDSTETVDSTPVPINDTEVPKFHDISGVSWAEPYIDLLAREGFINGTGPSTFSPDLNITRAEVVAILARMSGATMPEGNGGFNDVAADAWYAPMVAWAKQAGITKGDYDNNFHPNDEITKEEIATMLNTYMNNVIQKTLMRQAVEIKFQDEDQISDWAKSSVREMQLLGVVTGNGNELFNPTDHATRAEAAKMIGTLLQESRR